MNIKKIKQLKHGQVIRLYNLSYCIDHKYVKKMQYGNDIYYDFTTTHNPGLDPGMIEMFGKRIVFDKYSKNNNTAISAEGWWWPIEVIIDIEFKKIKIL